jgi:endogenous inhibitor of DNA gyrase (YacG/DUF329 family)
MAAKMTTVRCPQCGNEALWCPENEYRPFCSERCKLIDLGAWSSEAYRVPIPKESPDPSVGFFSESGDSEQ